jgi:Fasciclin domain
MKLNLSSYLLASSSSALLLFLTSVPVKPVTAQNTNNAGQIAADADTTTFNDFLASVGLSAGEGQTILAPNNGAFEKYALADPTMYTKYFTSNDYFLHRREVLQWLLVTEGRFTVADIFDGTRGQIANVNGNITIIQAVNGTTTTTTTIATLDGVPRTAIVKPDIATQDGIVHVMDTFIVAPYIGLNLIGLCLDDNSAKFEFATMAQLAIFTGLREVIDMVYDKGVTFLVPPTRRFNRGEIDIAELLTEAKKEYTKSLVSCHLILYTNYYESSVFSLHEENDIEETLELSYLGTNIWITTTDDRLRFQAVDVLLPDQVARNGYVFLFSCDVCLMCLLFRVCMYMYVARSFAGTGFHGWSIQIVCVFPHRTHTYHTPFLLMFLLVDTISPLLPPPYYRDCPHLHPSIESFMEWMPSSSHPFVPHFVSLPEPRRNTILPMPIVSLLQVA